MHSLRATIEARAHAILAQAGSYPAADDPRARNVAWGGSADYHLSDNERRKLREKSRALERGSPAYASVLTAACRVVVGADGPELVLPGVEPEQQKEIQAKWWADSEARAFDISGINTWGCHVSQMLRSALRDGDCLVWRDGSGRTAIFEADRVPRTTINETTGQILGYRVARYSERGTLMLDPKKLRTVSADEASLVAWRERVGQTRGAPALTPGLHWLERLSSLEESEIISAELSALPWSALEALPSQQQTLTAMTSPYADAQALGGAEIGGGVVDGPLSQVPAGWQRTDAGYMMAPPAGMKVTPWSPTRPNLNVPEFVREILRRVCAPLLPYEVLFADPGNLSHAAVRTVGLMAQHSCKTIRAQILGQTLDAIAREWLAKNFPKIRANRVEWRWPDLVIRDREKDAAASQRELDAGIASKESVLGPDWAIIQQQRNAEKEQSDAAAVERIKKLAELVKQSGVTGLHWAHLATLDGAATAPAGYAAATVPPQEPAPSGAVDSETKKQPSDNATRNDDQEDEDMEARHYRDIMAAIAAREPQHQPVAVTVNAQHVIDQNQVVALGEAIAASIRLPEMQAPVVNVAAPSVTVAAAESPQIIVPAPVVNVTNEVPVPAVTVENTVNIPKHKTIVNPQKDGSVIMTPVEG